MSESQDSLAEALMHMEIATTPGCPFEELIQRVWAAHYLVQSVLVPGSRPDNFDTVLAAAREHDAEDEALGLIEAMKRGLLNPNKS